MPTTAPAPTTSGLDQPRRQRTAAVLAAFGAGAAGINLALHALARQLGADFEIVSFIGMRQETVDLGAVLVMTLGSWLLGTLLLLTTQRSRLHWPWLAVAGSLLAVVTIPFFNEADTDTKIALGALHLATAGLWVAAVRVVSHRARTTP